MKGFATASNRNINLTISEFADAGLIPLKLTSADPCQSLGPFLPRVSDRLIEFPFLG